MRAGKNPQKEKQVSEDYYIHHIIMPVYIPHETEYYAHSFEILQKSLISLFRTIHKKTFITIVDNGSCDTVTHYLQDLFNQKKINELIVTTNIGKINAILKAIAGNDFRLTTITDADVLFLNGWQDATVGVYNSFPKAGVVGIVPQFKMFTTHCEHIIFSHWFSPRLRFTEVNDPEGMEKFYKSIGWNNDYNKEYLKKYLTIENLEGQKAVVGAGHFVATYTNKVINNIPMLKTSYALGGDSEKKYLDDPGSKVGLWRLTTLQNFAYHMGNTPEPWMDETLEKLKDESERGIIFMNTNSAATKRSTKLVYKFKRRLFKFKNIYKTFLRLKGLGKKQSLHY